jgi:hypothetical protein
MHVAIVPEGNVTGNSLGIAFFRRGPGEQALLLMTIMNSMAFEIQVRTQLATAHVSQGVLRRCTIPLACLEHAPLRALILPLVTRRLSHTTDCPELEIAIARAYGLSRAAFESVLDAFPKITPSERDVYLNSTLWS